MFGFIFFIISFLFQVGFTLSLIGLLVYDARVAWGKILSRKSGKSWARKRVR